MCMEGVVAQGSRAVALARDGGCRVKERSVVTLCGVGSQSGAVMTRHTQVAILYRGHSSFAVGRLMLCNQHLRHGLLGSLLCSPSYLGERIVVSSCSGISSCLPSLLAFSCLCAPGQSDLI